MENNYVLWRYPNQIKILRYLLDSGKKNISDISIDVKIIYSNCNISLRQLKEMKLIKVEETNDKRSVYYKLTKSGKKVAESIKEVNKVLEIKE